MKSAKYLILTAILFCTGCHLVKDYSYDGTANFLSNRTLLEHLESGKDTTLTLFLEAAKYAGIVDDYMTGNNEMQTFLIPSNGAFRGLMKDGGVEKITDIDRNVLRSLMEYLILPGKHISMEMEQKVINKIITVSGDRIYIARIPTTRDEYAMTLNPINPEDPTYGGTMAPITQQDMVFKDKVAQVVGVFPVYRLLVRPSDVYTAPQEEVVRLETAGDTHVYNGAQVGAVYWGGAVHTNLRSNAFLRTAYILFEKKEVHFANGIASATLNVFVTANDTSAPSQTELAVYDISSSVGNYTVKTMDKTFRPPHDKRIGTVTNIETSNWNRGDLTTFVQELYNDPDHRPLAICLKPPVAHVGGAMSLGYKHEDTHPVGSRNPAFITISGIFYTELWVVNNEPLVCPKGSNAALSKEVLAMEGPENPTPNPDPAIHLVYSDNNIIYTLKELPAGGVVTRNGLPIGLDMRFTQAELAAGLVKYFHSGESASDSFKVQVSDYSGGILDGLVTIPVTIQ